MPRAKRRRERYRTRSARTPIPVAPRRGERWSPILMSDTFEATHQIEAMAGHQSLSEVGRNTHGADRERMDKPLMRHVENEARPPKTGHTRTAFCTERKIIMQVAEWRPRQDSNLQPAP